MALENEYIIYSLIKTYNVINQEAQVFIFEYAMIVGGR
jgi:hypothetical protein